MNRIPLKRQEDIGLSPYELKFRGQHRSQEVQMTLFNIDAEEVMEKEVHSVDELEKYHDKHIWMNIDGLHNEMLMSDLAKRLQIPSEILSDVMEPGTRPQIEEFDNGLFLSIKMMQFDESLNQVSIDNFSIILIDNWIITFQEEPNCLFNPVKERLIKHANRFRELGTDYLAFPG
jgi:magnesium transporter